MNLDHDFFQLSKLSKEQKKFFSNNGTLFFPEFIWTPPLRCTPESNYWRGCRCRPYSNYWGDTVKLLAGYIPPGFRHPCWSCCCVLGYDALGRLILSPEVESLRMSLASRTSSRTHFEVLGLGLEGQVLGLGLEASSP